MKLVVLTLVFAAVAAGCGGDAEVQSEPLRTGVYEYELTKEYLLENGIGQAQAEDESGQHQVTLQADGSFKDAWRTADGSAGSCQGTYSEGDGRLVTFKWTYGCFGDWEMTYAVEGDQVTWSDQKSLPPYDSDEDQKVNEVFNNVPWTRVGDVS